MKATGVLLVILGCLNLLGACMAESDPASVPRPFAAVIGALFLIGGLIVWSLQQIREAILAGLPDAPEEPAAEVTPFDVAPEYEGPLPRKPRWAKRGVDA